MTDRAAGERFGLLVAVMLAFAAGAPACAHHMSSQRGGSTVGIVIPAISHGEMPIIAKYRKTILDLAARQVKTDPILRRLSGFVSLQHFACFWGLVPGSLMDETSPFNECAHADLAGARAMLIHMAAMAGDQSSARALKEQIDEELNSDPATSVICSNSQEAFDSAIVVWPDWGLAPSHLPTLLTFLGLVLLAGVGLTALFGDPRRPRLRLRKDSASL